MPTLLHVLILRAIPGDWAHKSPVCPITFARDGLHRVQADDELPARAKRRADECGVSVAQLVRDALEKELSGSGQTPPPVTIIGIGRSNRSDRGPRVVPAPMLVELEYLLRAASDTAAFKGFLENCSAGAFTIAAMPEDYVRVGELLERYADLRLGFVDASVLAVTERLREPKLATLDLRHFSMVGPRRVAALELLPA